MKDFNVLLKEKFQDEGFAREYYRNATYFRLADQILQLRKERGLTQTELADKAGTTQAVVSRLENVSVRASLESVVKLAEALDAIVEVNLKPFEEVKPFGEEQQKRERSFNLYRKVTADLAHSEADPKPKMKTVTIDPPCWSLTDRPLVSVGKEKKVPEFA